MCISTTKTRCVARRFCRWLPAGPQRLEGLNVGAVDVGFVGEASPIFAQAAGAQFVYIGYDPAAPEAEAIVVPKGSAIQSVADLKGKKVALNKGSNVHYLLVKALEKAGLKYTDIQPVFLLPADARAAFERGSVDAWVIWDPFLAAVEKQSGARLLADGRGVVNNYAYYLAERGYTQKHPQVIQALFDDTVAQGPWLKANLKQAAAIVAPLQGLDVEVVEKTLARGQGARAATFDYFKQIAVAADSLGYEGVLLPTGRSCEDSWIVAATLDRLSGGRLLVNLVTGGDAEELAGDGQFLSHAARYEESAEFIRIWREVIARSHTGESLDFEGRHLRVEGAKLLYPPGFFGGSSEPAHELAAEQVDTCLTWGEPPAAVAAKLADVRERAAAELVSHLDEATVAAAQARLGQMESVGQRRMAELNKGKFNKADVRAGLEVSPNLWAGVGLVRGGAGLAQRLAVDPGAARAAGCTRCADPHRDAAADRAPVEAAGFHRAAGHARRVRGGGDGRSGRVDRGSPHRAR